MDSFWGTLSLSAFWCEGRRLWLGVSEELSWLGSDKLVDGRIVVVIHVYAIENGSGGTIGPSNKGGFY